MIMEKYKIILVSMYICCVLFNYFELIPGAWLLILTIIMNFYYMYIFRNNQPILICLFFALTYWGYMILYYWFGIFYCTYLKYCTVEYTNGTLRIAGLFMVFLFSAIKPYKSNLRQYFPVRNNILIYLASLSVMLFIIIYAFQVGDAFSYKNEGVNSSLYEYYFIFSLSAFCFAKSKFKKNILLLVNIIYIIVLLRLGTRLVVLQVSLMLFVQYFENKFKTKWIILTVFLGFFFMSFWSMFRHGFSINTLDLFSLLGIRADRMMVTNQGDVFYTSTAQYAQSINGNWNMSFRISTMLAFFFNIILLPKYQLPVGKLNEILASQSSLVPGGGFGAMYAYIWLDILGVFFLAIFIANAINSIAKTKSEIKKIYGIFLIFTFFRWYAYNLAIIFKMGFWLLLVYQLLKKFDKCIKI